MGQSPLPDAFAVFGPAEVILVLGTRRPLALAGRLGSPTAIRLSTEALPPAIARIKEVLFIAIPALEGGFGTHRRVENKPPEPSMHATCVEENPASVLLKKTREEDAGRRVFSEALEEDVALTPSDVHPAGSIGLPEWCPHAIEPPSATPLHSENSAISHPEYPFFSIVTHSSLRFKSRGGKFGSLAFTHAAKQRKAQAMAANCVFIIGQRNR
jgi:hypothetical protein